MDFEDKAIDRIYKATEMSLKYYGKPLIVTYSGGKDSDVLLELFKRSGVEFEVVYSLTTTDAPPTVRHVKSVFHELELENIKCIIDTHNQPDGSRITMWNLIPQKFMPPTRIVRYCCSVLKESSPFTRNRMIATGVRKDESSSRSKREPYEVIGKTKRGQISITDERFLLTDNDETRQLYEQCFQKRQTVVNPIIDWPDYEVWNYYWNECPKHNPAYSMGYYRTGCVGCPLATKRERIKEFADFPTYKRAYIRSFDKMLERLKERRNDVKWETGQDVFDWWIEDENVEGQMSMEFEGENFTGYKEKGKG